ncbi:MAG: hypothetical protein WC538_00215 [Thermoanaerobaculia bacterium]|jgi:hypothetical protein
MSTLLLRFVLSAVLALPALTLSRPLLAEEKGPDGMFDAVAEVKGPQGTRSMPVTIEVRNPMTLAEAQGLRDVLEKGGQQALANAIRGANRGSLMLGAVSYPLDIVVAEPEGDRWKYAIVTVRNFHWNEEALGEESLDFPFTVVTFEAPGFGRGEGKVMPRAALSIGADGRLAVEKYQGTDGRMKDVKRR